MSGPSTLKNHYRILGLNRTVVEIIGAAAQFRHSDYYCIAPYFADQNVRLRAAMNFRCFSCDV